MRRKPVRKRLHDELGAAEGVEGERRAVEAMHRATDNRISEVGVYGSQT